MQFNQVNNKEMLLFPCIWVHGVVLLSCQPSHAYVHRLTYLMWSQCSSYLKPSWEKHWVAFVFSLSSVVFSISAFLIFMPPFLYLTLFSLFPLLSRFDGCADVPVWRLRVGLQGLLVMGAFYCLGAGWLQWRPQDTRGTHLLLSDVVVKSGMLA